ncbi:hypothetical protein FRC07_009970, partial [Ceratobasidium sp. 392]
MTYGEITRGLHDENTMLDLHCMSLDLTTKTYCYYFDSPIIVPAPTMHDMDYFPHRVLVLGTKCIGCLRSRTDPTCGCGPGYDCTHPSCTAPVSRSSTPRGPTSASIRRSNTYPRSKHPYSGRRSKHNHSHPKIQRSRSLTDIHASSALAPSPLRNCAAFDEAGAPLPPVSARVGPVYESSEAVPRPGMQHTQSYPYVSATPYPIQTPATARQGYLQTPPTVTTRASNSPVITPVTSIMVTPASATTISPVSPIRTRFGFSMTQMPTTVAPGEGIIMARAPEGGVEDDVEDADIRTEVGSPEMNLDAREDELRLPPIRTLPPLPSYGPGPKAMLVAEQTRLAMRGGGTGISRDVLLYGPAGVTPAPAELSRNNARNKLSPISSH